MDTDERKRRIDALVDRGIITREEAEKYKGAVERGAAAEAEREQAEAEASAELARLKANGELPTVTTVGRTDLDDLWKISGLRDGRGTNHTPFIAFVTTSKTEIAVRLHSDPSDLLAYSDDTPVMVQWRGHWRSDFFKMTVCDVRAALAHEGVPSSTAGREP